MRFQVTALATLLCALSPGLARAQTPDPLRLIPAAADAVAKVENPHALYDAVYEHEVFQKFLKIDAVAAFYDTTNFRRALQLLGYFEKELGHPRFDLLDRLAGGGVAFAAQFEKKAVVLVVQAKDEELLKKFVAVARKVVDQELDRLESKEKVRSAKYRDLETLHLGKLVYAARAGSALVFANDAKALHKALDLHLDGGKNSVADKPVLTEIKGHLPERPLIWGALNLEQVRAIPAVKNSLNTLGLDPITMFAIGGLVDIIKRTPYVCAGLARDGNNWHARIAMPRGREGMAPLAAMFLPEDDRGTLPMLQPPRVLSSTSYFLDLGKFWENRHKILTPEQAKSMDQFENQTSKYLKGVGLGTILKQSGKYQRVIVAIPDKFPYKNKPTVQTGAFAVVLHMRDPAFADSMGKVLRGAALVGGFKYGVKMVAEKHGEHTLVTYYFPEKGKFDGDEFGIRFNFNPCFTHVGDQFVIASTLDLGKDLVDCLIKEGKDGTSPATSRTHVYGTGIAANIRQSEDLLVSQAILSQAVPAAQAKKQFEELATLVEGLGQVRFETRYGERDFRFDVRWLFDKK
jgi:hypothetical protein